MVKGQTRYQDVGNLPCLLQQEGLVPGYCCVWVGDRWGGKSVLSFGFIKGHLQGRNSGLGAIFEFWLWAGEVICKKPLRPHGNDAF